MHEKNPAEETDPVFGPGPDEAPSSNSGRPAVLDPMPSLMEEGEIFRKSTESLSFEEVSRLTDPEVIRSYLDNLLLHLCATLKGTALERPLLDKNKSRIVQEYLAVYREGFSGEERVQILLRAFRRSLESLSRGGRIQEPRPRRVVEYVELPEKFNIAAFITQIACQLKDEIVPIIAVYKNIGTMNAKQEVAFALLNDPACPEAFCEQVLVLMEESYKIETFLPKVRKVSAQKSERFLGVLLRVAKHKKEMAMEQRVAALPKKSDFVIEQLLESSEPPVVKTLAADPTLPRKYLVQILLEHFYIRREATAAQTPEVVAQNRKSFQEMARLCIEHKIPGFEGFEVESDEQLQTLRISMGKMQICLTVFANIVSRYPVGEQGPASTLREVLGWLANFRNTWISFSKGEEREAALREFVRDNP